MFANLANVQDGPEYFNPGKYRVVLIRAKIVVSKNPKTKGQEKFVTEWTVTEVMAAHPATATHEASNREGRTVSHSVNPNVHPDYSLPELKNVIEAFVGACAALLTAEELATIQAAADQYDAVGRIAVSGDGTRLAGAQAICLATEREGGFCRTRFFQPDAPQASTPAISASMPAPVAVLGNGDEIPF